MFLDNYINKIVESRKRLESYAPYTPEITSDFAIPNRVSYSLKWTPSQIQKPATMAIPESRDFVAEKLDEYFACGEGVLLLTPNPGQGKSTTAIRQAQKLAREGKRVLYLMPRHDYWHDITGNPFTEIDLWHHWLSVDGERDGEEMCRFASSANAWARKGYKLIDHCKALCEEDGHMRVCPYRQQRRTKKKIIAGVHNHLTTGLAISDFDVVFIDELPIGAFVDERTIPAKFIDVGARGAVKKLTDKLQEICVNAHGDVRGEELLAKIADILPDIYENVNLTAQWMPLLPEIKSPEDVYSLREWYIYDLLLLLMPEFYAYKAGRHGWMSRVIASRQGVKLLQKKELWEKLPSRIVVMDGTGDKGVYEMLFGKSVTVVNPEVNRQGRIFQITERSYNISSVQDRGTGKLKKAGEELMELAKLITESKPLDNGKFGKYQNVGIVTFKKIRHYFDALYGEENVLHFGGNRGTNAFVGKDCILVLGTPSPPDSAMIDLMAQLTFDMNAPEESRVEGFAPVQTPNGIVPLRTVLEKPYLYVNNGMMAQRATSGFWFHSDLQAVYEMYRAGEIEQSGHRGRPLTSDCDVWLVTSCPTSEWLDGLWESPNECLDLPRDVHWSRWPNLKRWLYRTELFVPVSEIAEREDVSRQWATRWANSVAEWRPYEWQFSTDPNHEGVGRPQSGLVRIS